MLPVSRCADIDAADVAAGVIVRPANRPANRGLKIACPRCAAQIKSNPFFSIVWQQLPRLLTLYCVKAAEITGNPAFVSRRLLKPLKFYRKCCAIRSMCVYYKTIDTRPLLNSSVARNIATAIMHSKLD
jgi:hypothetical protein